MEETIPVLASSSSVAAATAEKLPLSARLARWWASRSRAEIFLFALLLLLFAVRNFPWRLDNLDQAKSAYVSLEMLTGNDDANRWWYQHTPGHVHLATKPPLVGWMSALFFYPCFGNWDLAWRLPSLLAAIALTLALWSAGHEEWPRLGGLLALGAFGLNLLTPRLATLVRTDMVLTLWITLPGLLIWWKLHRSLARPSSTSRLTWTGRERLGIAAFVLLGMMTKGPVIYAFLLPGLLLHTWISRRRGWHATAPAWSGWPEWFLPFVPFAIWSLVGASTVPGFYENVVVHEFLGRFTVGKKAVHNNQPIYFYFAQLLKQWAPWSFLTLSTFFLAPRRRWWRAFSGDSATLWLFCWTVGGFVLMSLVPSKRVDRIFPIVPPLCLLLTAALARLHREQQSTDLVVTNDTAPTRVAFWSRAALVSALILSCAATGYYIQQDVKKHVGRLANFGAHARRLVEQNGWRCEVVSDLPQLDEPTLVYLRRLHFLTPAEAVTARAAGRADTFVVPERLWWENDRDAPAAWREKLGKADIVWKSSGGSASTPASAPRRRANPALTQSYLLIHCSAP